MLVYGAQIAGYDNNYQNTELREWIAFHVMIEWLYTSMLGCVH